MNTGTPTDYEKLVTNYKLRSIRDGRSSIYSFFFRLLLSNCLNWKIYWDDHSSFSSTTAVQIWIISYTSHQFYSSRLGRRLRVGFKHNFLARELTCYQQWASKICLVHRFLNEGLVACVQTHPPPTSISFRGWGVCTRAKARGFWGFKE